MTCGQTAPNSTHPRNLNWSIYPTSVEHLQTRQMPAWHHLQQIPMMSRRAQLLPGPGQRLACSRPCIHLMGQSDDLPSLLSWSCALIFFPRILLLAIGQSQRPQLLTPLESFLALHFGLLLAFSAVGLVINVKPLPSLYPRRPPPTKSNV